MSSQLKVRANAKTPITDALINELASAPDALNKAQAEVDRIRLEYDRSLVDLSIQALSIPLFPGKTSEDPKRAAANEKERDLAIQFMCQHDAAFGMLAVALEDAQRELTLRRDRQTNFRLIAQLVLQGSK